MMCVPSIHKTGIPAANRQMGADDMSVLSGEMRFNEPMSQHTSWRAGGKAKRFYIPADEQDLARMLSGLPDSEQVYVVGLGSNLLVRDGGVQGTVIGLHARLNALQLIEHTDGDGLVYAGAGVPCAKMARFAARNNLAGAEFLTGIPGTIGGALAMNAGCYGAETWQTVKRVRVVGHHGEIHERMADQYQVGYRSVRLMQGGDTFARPEWFVGGYFSWMRGDQSESRQKMKELLARRVNSQPLNLPNAGSVFRNPPGDHAARLIQACGLKGCAIGGAMVSPKHANFIVNTGQASATDIETLILLVQDKVESATGITLVPEVRIIGDAGRFTA